MYGEVGTHGKEPNRDESDNGEMGDEYALGKNRSNDGEPDG